MKIDLSEFNELDFENIGSWAPKVKFIFALAIAFCVFLAGYFLFIADALDELEAEKSKEQELRQEFKVQYRFAANLDLYHKQLTELESQYAQVLGMLPSQDEMPSLLDDLTFVATDNGLRITSLNWQPQMEKELYLEFPINMSVMGDYHQFGQMVAGIAKLPRIVSLHDFSIKKQENGLLAMDIQAKTYRFKEVDNQAAANNKEAK